MHIPVLFLLILGYTVTCDPGCVQQETCADCMGFSAEICVWCSTGNFKGKRCQAKSSVMNQSDIWCNDVEDPQNKRSVQKNQMITPIVNNKLDSMTTVKKVSLMPQHVKVNIRPNTKSTFDVSYHLGMDFPIDVYLLSDFSDTMRQKKKILQDQTQAIVEQLSKISTNVHIGFGTFVEKPAIPLADQKHIDKNLAFVFNNNIPLTEDVKAFSRYIKELTPNGANLDDPEAGLEALMQVIVCNQEIGWRDEARRIVVLLTDSVSHMVGDGRIVGAFRPNDMKCHLKDNKYDRNAALTLDYPSLGQINKVAREKDVLIFFAVDKKVKKFYDSLTTKIEGSTSAVFTSDLSNLIEKSYKDKLRFPKLNVKSPSNIHVSLDPPCMDQHLSPECEAKNFETKKVLVSVMVLECFESKAQVEISVVGINDKLIVEVESMCRCACEADRVNNSRYCSDVGTYECGICKCHGAKSGKICNCDVNTDIDDDNCIKSGLPVTICSNRGDCRCGKCENCRDRSHGEFCEYTDMDCPWPGRKVCAGHGDCRYGKCYCHSGWEKDDCTCPDNDRACIEPYSRKVCSENGKCECGKCICAKKSADNNSSGTYSGDYCDDCVDCAQSRCESLEVLVECVFNSIGKKYNNCSDKYDDNNNIEVLIAIENKTTMYEDQYRQYAWCNITKNDAVIVFRHKFVSNELRVMIQNEKDLPLKMNVWVAVLWTVGVILLVGLITIVAWKILVDIHDAKEYKNFEAEIQALGLEDMDEVGFHNDQVYIPPVFEFKNPMYGQN